MRANPFVVEDWANPSSTDQSKSTRRELGGGGHTVFVRLRCTPVDTGDRTLLSRIGRSRLGLDSRMFCGFGYGLLVPGGIRISSVSRFLCTVKP